MALLVLNGPSFPLTERDAALAAQIFSEESKQAMITALAAHQAELTLILLVRPFRSVPDAEKFQPEANAWAWKAVDSLESALGLSSLSWVYGTPATVPIDPGIDTVYTLPSFLHSRAREAEKAFVADCMEHLGVVPMLTTPEFLNMSQPPAMSGIKQFSVQICGRSWNGFDAPRLAPGAPLWSLWISPGCMPLGPLAENPDRDMVRIEVPDAGTSLRDAALRETSNPDFADALVRAYADRNPAQIEY